MTEGFPNRTIQVDYEGFFHSDGIRISDPDYGQALLQSLQRDERGRFIAMSAGVAAAVEAFDQPLVVQMVERTQGKILALMPYGFTTDFPLNWLCVDEWDRFLSRTESGIPMVLSRAAQAKFFNIVDDYDDDSITIDGKKITPEPWLLPSSQVSKHDFWTDVYKTQTPPWDLGSPSPVLPQIIPQLKLPRAKILVLGCGSGHDAAYLAQLGHLVTAVDFSDEALSRARSEYGDLKNLTFYKYDLFSLPDSWANTFDIIFEHTCYCAITPERRSELVQLWRKVLHEGGHLLGIFFAWDKPTGPPWGGSEWEVRERLRKNFRFHYWTRWHHSAPQRQGLEFVVYAQMTS